MIRGELRASFTTKWFYEACGANKLSQTTKAWRSRFKIEVKSLAPVIKSRLSLKPADVKTSFQAVVTSTPSAKSARLDNVKDIKYTWWHPMVSETSAFTASHG